MVDRSAEHDLFLRRLRELRKGAGLSQAELAALLGVTGQHVTSVERGTTGYSVELLSKWAEQCGASLHSVFTTEGRQHVLDAAEAMPEREFELVAQLVVMMEHLPERYRHAFLEQLYFAGELVTPPSAVDTTAGRHDESRPARRRPS